MSLFRLYIKSVLLSVIFFWSMLQITLGLGGLLTKTSMVANLSFFVVIFLILAISAFKDSRRVSMAHSSLCVTIGVWTFLYPRLKYESFTFLSDTYMYSIQKEIYSVIGI